MRAWPLLAAALLLLASGSGSSPVQLERKLMRLRAGAAPPILDDDVSQDSRLPNERTRKAIRKRHSSYNRLRRGRVGVFVCLYLFALLNGLARRSLSSAAPSLVQLGHVNKAQLDQLFSMGYEAFALGKFLVAPVLLALGPKRAAMLQITVIILASSAFCLYPGSLNVQVLSLIHI